MSPSFILVLSLAIPPAADALPGPKGYQPLFDAVGDMLPEGAIARLGSDRWKLNAYNQSILFSKDGKRCFCTGNQFRIFEYPSGCVLSTGNSQGQVGRHVRLTPDERYLVTYNPEQNFLTRYDLATNKPVQMNLPGTPGLRSDGNTAHQLTVAKDGRQGIALQFRNGGSGLRYEVYRLRIDNRLSAARLGDGATARVIQLQQSISGDGAYGLVIDTVDPGGTGYDLTANVWDMKSGRRTALKFHTEGMSMGCDFSPDGRHFLVSAQDGMRVFANPLAEGGNGPPRKVAERISNPNIGLGGMPFFATQFLVSGDRLLIGTISGELEMAEFPGLKTIWRRRVANGSGNVASIAYTPDRKSIAFTTDSGMGVRFMDLATGVERDPRGHTESVTGIKFHPTEPLLATSAESDCVRLWRGDGKRFGPAGALSATTRDPQAPAGHGRVVDFQFTQGGKRLTVYDAFAHLLDFDVASRRRVTDRLGGNTLAYTTISPDGRWILGMDMQGSTLQLTDGEKVHQPEAPRNEIGLRQYGFSADGKYAALATRAGRFFHIAAATGKRVDPAVARPAFTGASRYVASMDVEENAATMRVQLWDVRAGGRVSAGLRSTRCFAFSEDGRYAVLNSQGQRLVELASGNVVRSWNVKMPGGDTLTARDMCFSPDGKLLAVAEDFGTTLLFDMDPTAKVFQKKAPKDIDEMLARLRGRDAARAYAAIGYALLHPKESLEAFRKTFKPAPPPDDKRVDALFAKLASDRFAVRWEAAGALAALAPLLVDRIEAALAATRDADLKDWLTRIRVAPALPLAEQGDLFGVRMVEILERMGGAEAAALLAEAAKSGDRAGLAARQALERKR